MTELEQTSVNDLSPEEVANLKDRVEDLEDQLMDLENMVESIQRRNDEMQFAENNFVY